MSSSKTREDIETETVNADVTGVSRARQLASLIVICLAQFFDIFNSSSAIILLPTLGDDLGFSQSELQWVLSAYALTFGSLMLISGRIGDVFHPKPVFCAGFLVMGLLSIPVAASVHPIMTIVFRALQGLGAALNVPTGLSMIGTMFTDPREKSRAFALFAAIGGIGNVAGLLIGGFVTVGASWRWVYYISAMAIVPTSLAAWLVLPDLQNDYDGRKRNLDIPGVATLTCALILLVYALSEGGDAGDTFSGWSSPQVIATLVISVVLLVAFFVIEKVQSDPALPPQTWRNKNFIPLFFCCWSPYWWLFVCAVNIVQLHVDVWGVSLSSTALRCIPLGVTGGFASMIVGQYAHKVPRRLLLTVGQVLQAVGTVLFALADSPDKYWSRIFPGIIVGMMGMACSYVGSTVAMMEGAAPNQQGVVGAVMSTSYQIGATIGLAGKH
ncbi:major facilitator superfamily domain-containing protein [Schizophyllum amplum]|uniref:Major facilitator superfamily domain-containing protein n=1 Tax=Schizophyllum amplum TaxID=97359 RepID=A0A550C3R2_9AGAR|nr:major facilitator superfamily domain-containing protein [Auriculariopsis ampla]